MGKRRRNTLFDEALAMNEASYRFYLERLIELSISMFEWQNLPDSVDARFIERTLFMNGACVVFKDEDLNEECIEGVEKGTLLALPVALAGGFDIYNIPVKRRAYATNGYQRDLTNKDSIVVYNNMLRTNSVMACKIFAKRLWDLDRTIDINAKAQKTPVLVQGTEEQRLTLLNLYEKWDGNEPFIFGTSNLDMNALKVLSTGAPFVANDLYELRNQIWNEALTYLGISNVNNLKRERMISDEVMRNQGGTMASRYSRLEARREACEKINKMFGTNIEVYYRDDTKYIDDYLSFDPTADNEAKEAAGAAAAEGGVGNE